MGEEDGGDSPQAMQRIVEDRSHLEDDAHALRSQPQPGKGFESELLLHHFAGADAPLEVAGQLVEQG